MFRYTGKFFGGHSDLFPNTKAGAHLTPKWVLSRTPLPPPKAGHCYASFTRPEKHSKFQAFQPELHQSKVVPMNVASALPHCTTKRLSSSACAAFMKGVKNTFDNGNKKANDSPIALANIADKKRSETIVKVREFTPHEERMTFHQRYTPFADVLECCDFIDKRTNALRKIEDQNTNGYTKEWMPFELNPPPKQVPPSAKK